MMSSIMSCLLGIQQEKLSIGMFHIVRNKSSLKIHSSLIEVLKAQALTLARTDALNETYKINSLYIYLF